MSTELKPPIILIGNYRSGTTMIHDLFDLHPEVRSWFEPRTIWQYAAPGRRHDRFDASDARPRVIRYVRRRFLERQLATGGHRVMEKTPTNVLRIPYVHRVFPESRLIYVVRDPLAILSSAEIIWRRGPTHLRRAWQRFRECPRTQAPGYFARYAFDRARRVVYGERYRKIWGVRYPGIHEDRRRMTNEQVIASQWVHCVRQADEDIAAIESTEPGSILRLRYENFVNDPVAQFRRLLEHVGLSASQGLVERAAALIDPNRQQKWHRLEPRVLHSCLPILRDEMARQGYALPPDIGACQ